MQRRRHSQATDTYQHTKFLDTTGRNTLSVGVCDRCNRKFPYSELQSDPNFPGLRVCPIDRDELDPWRLAARKPETITLRYPRPDVSIAVQTNAVLTQDGQGLGATGTGDLATETNPSGK